MYTIAKFQSIGTTSDFGTKFAENYMNNKTFEKRNIKIEISVYTFFYIYQQPGC